MDKQLQAWLRKLEAMQPDRIELGLDRIKTVARAAGLDRPGFRIVTVAGTNGKGSTVAYIDSVLRRSGFVTGVYTSPHFIDFTERVVVDTRQASASHLCEAFDFIELSREQIDLTYFEFTTLAAIYCFAKAGIDVAILEVGLGGRLDAVNAWDSEVACISSIGIDHTDWLGDDRESIGREKAGVARSGCSLVCGERNLPASVTAVATEAGAELVLVDEHFSVTSADNNRWHYQGPYGELFLQPARMAGRWVPDNAAVAVCASSLFLGRQPSAEAVQGALDEVVLAGRMQQFRYRGIDVLLDVAHNPAAAAMLASYLDIEAHNRVVAVFGCMQDKDAAAVLAELKSVFDNWYITEIDYPRAMPGARLAEIAGADDSAIFGSVISAFEAAVAQSRAGDLVVVLGSFHVVGPVLQHLREVNESGQ